MLAMTRRQEELYRMLEERVRLLQKSNTVERLGMKIAEALETEGFLQGVDFDIAIRYKTPGSIREKIMRKQYTRASQMQDLGGICITVLESKCVDIVKEIMQKQFNPLNVHDYRRVDNRAYKGININLTDDIEVQIKDAQKKLIDMIDHMASYKNDMINPRCKEAFSRALREQLQEGLEGEKVGLNEQIEPRHVDLAVVAARRFFRVGGRVSYSSVTVRRFKVNEQQGDKTSLRLQATTYSTKVKIIHNIRQTITGNNNYKGRKR